MVTTPQEAAAEVAERAGTMASMMHQRVVGVVENMSLPALPALRRGGPEHRLEVFGSGGGERVADDPVAAVRLRRPACSARSRSTSRCARAATSGKPIVESDPTAPAAVVLPPIADALAGRGRGLAGMQLGLTPTGRF